MQQNRSTQRKLVGLLVKLGHKGLDEFAAKYATNLSDGGMFIRTREPKAIGTELSFKVEIADGQRVLQGTAIVRWTRPDNDPGGPPGMGLEFVTLDPASRALVDRMLGVKPPALEEDEPFDMSAPGAPAAATAPRPPAAPIAPPSGVPAARTATGPLSPPSGIPAARSATGPLSPPSGIPAARTATGPRSPSSGVPSARPAPGPLSPPSGIPSARTATGPLSPPSGVPSVPPTSPSSGAPAASLAPLGEAPDPFAAFGAPPTAPPSVPKSARGTGPVAVAPAAPPSVPKSAVAPVVPKAARSTGPIAAPPPPANDPFAAFGTPPVPPPEPPAYAPALETDVSGSIEIEAEPVVFGDVGPRNTDNTIEVDYAALLEGLPATPPAAEVDLDVGIDLDLESIEPLEPMAEDAPAALPHTPLAMPEAPPMRREAAAPTLPPVRRERLPEPPAPPPENRAPVTLEQRSAPIAMGPPKLEPVYLRNVTPSDGTGPVIGIDLGTTNSACAVLSKGRPMILTSKDGYNTIPSVVALTKDGKLQVGHRAKSQMVLNPTQSIVGAKRLVGREFDSPTVTQLKERAHFEIIAGSDRRAAVRLGQNALSLEEVQALVLKECREMAEQTLGTKVSRAVVTCPAYYSEPQREAVRRAGAMAGLKVERVLNEPTAAALAFGMNRELKKTVLVYDLGGGTFDATLLKLDQNVFEVLATGGDVFLGGVDFDNQIVDLLLERFSQWHKRPFSGDRVALSRMAEVAEKAKMALSERTSFDVNLPMLEMDSAGKPLDLRTTLTRADLEAKTSDLIDRTLQAVQDVLLDAKLKASQVDDIILVGGMSRMPLVREKLKALFKKPPHASVNADEAVALGAALYSGTVDKVSSLVLIDVVPMTIGLGRPGGAFHRLIERNTALPAAKSFAISTQKDDQTELEVMVFQGEDSNVAGNEFLGAVTITGLPKGPKGSVQVAVTLGLDAECVLRVEAREFKTRSVVRATLATRYTTEEIAQRLGITKEKSAAVNKSRDEELGMRAGGFWSKLKGLFGR